MLVFVLALMLVTLRLWNSPSTALVLVPLLKFSWPHPARKSTHAERLFQPGPNTGVGSPPVTPASTPRNWGHVISTSKPLHPKAAAWVAAPRLVHAVRRAPRGSTTAFERVCCD